MRWDDPNKIEEHELTEPADAEELVARFAVDQPKSLDSSVKRTIDVFRSLRSNLASYDGNAIDAIRILNVLLLWADALSTGTAAVGTSQASLSAAIAQLGHQGALSYSISDFSPTLGDFPLGDLADQLLQERAGYQLDPYLLIRHASGTLFQEAHIELERPPPMQRKLFLSLDDRALPLSGVSRRDARYTPTFLARFLADAAINKFRELNPIAMAIDVLDPACGSGVFLIEAARSLGTIKSAKLRGVDNSDASTAIADFAVRQAARSASASGHLVEATILKGDSLVSESWSSPDVVLMNPPFLSWRTMTSELKQTVRKSLGRLYVGQSDTAIAFIARALRELKPGAVLATLAPASVLDSRAASKLRKWLAADASLSIDMIGLFRGFKLFADAAVEPAFLLISRTPRRPNATRFIIAESGAEDRAVRAARLIASGTELLSGKGYEVGVRLNGSLSSEDWTPRPLRGMRVVAQWLSSGMPRVTDLFDVRLGIRTGNNAVFLVSGDDLRAGGASLEERNLFRSVANDIRHGQVRSNAFVFYPYRQGKLSITTEAGLEKTVPWFFATRLRPNRETLEKRRSLRDRHWWELSEPRTTWLEASEPRLLTPAFGFFGSFAYDGSNEYAVVQGSAWSLRSHARDSGLLLAYLALVNSYQFESLLQLLCPRVSGGQYQIYRADVGRVPIPDLSHCEPGLRQELADAGQKIIRGNGLDPIGVGPLVCRAYHLADDAFESQFAKGDVGTTQHVFDQLAAEWRRQRGHSSKVQSMTSVPAYRNIIDLYW
ncbi:MAG: SAM-dependent DNA methyltransferase [Planctomycetia bacterium]|nr:SAM-dependent DNA methyltransferase [Planctomycetia bacterium]